MVELRTKGQLSEAAKTLAHSFALVQRASTLYIPVQWETGSPVPPPKPEETLWLPLSREDKLSLASTSAKVLFASDGEFRSFEFMLKQLSRPAMTEAPRSILIKTKNGLMMLDETGTLIPHTGMFVPNFAKPVLNEDPGDKAFVFNTLTDWLGGSEDEARSLLAHFATVLSPFYSAVKYVLLLGDGRNGKGVLLAMLAGLFGSENVSHITRQMMAEAKPTCVELNNKLLNLVFDGQMSYIKDSSLEKTFTAGETGVIRMLYDSGTTPVQTNALFVEALNREPKARDKSQALQKRLMRYWFPNTYEQDKAFHKKMTSQRYLGAFLSLLIDNYVKEDELSERLAPTKSSLELQVEQMFLGSPVLQYIEHIYLTQTQSMELLEKGRMTVDQFIGGFRPWCSDQGFDERSDADLTALLRPYFEIGWKTIRDHGGTPRNQKVLRSLKPDTLLALQQLKEGAPADAAATDEELVGDGDLPEQPTDPILSV